MNARVVKSATALVGRVSSRLNEAEVTYVERQQVDGSRASMQHEKYCELLAHLGVNVVKIPTCGEHPDGVFVEDAAVVVKDFAILTRPGVPSRRGETRAVCRSLASHVRRVVKIHSPGTLDGGDVLQVGRTIFVGQSTRTNDAAIEQVQEYVEPFGRQVVPVRVEGALHLKTAVTALPDGALIARTEFIDVDAFGHRMIVEAGEPTGANALSLANCVVLSRSAPKTAAAVRSRGLQVHIVDVGEFEKVEAGPTCLSIII